MGNDQSKDGQRGDSRYENHGGKWKYMKSWLTWSTYPGPPPLLKTPFLPDFELNEKKQEDLLKEFEQLEYEAETINCLLVGQVNSGKSSFINSIVTALSNHKDILRPSTVLKPSGMEKTCTKFIESIPIYVGKSGKLLPLKMFDCRGLHDLEGVQTKDLFYFLDGHIKDRYEVNPSRAITKSDDKFRENPSIDEMMHCIIYVVNAQNPEGALASKTAAETFKNLRENISKKHIPQLVLMSKADRLRASFANDMDLEKLFYSQEVREKVRQISRFTCIDECDIMPQVNYEKSGRRSSVRDTLTLYNLIKIMRRAIYYKRMCKDKGCLQRETGLSFAQTKLSE